LAVSETPNVRDQAEARIDPHFPDIIDSRACRGIKECEVVDSKTPGMYTPTACETAKAREQLAALEALMVPADAQQAAVAAYEAAQRHG
jgi:hypothetical protein